MAVSTNGSGAFNPGGSTSSFGYGAFSIGGTPTPHGAGAFTLGMAALNSGVPKSVAGAVANAASPGGSTFPPVVGGPIETGAIPKVTQELEVNETQ